MYCTKCGALLDEKTGVCPSCGAVDPEAVPTAHAAPTRKKRSFGFGAATKNAKSYAVIFTALMVFPAMICTVINLIGSSEKFWAGYVLGALAVAWVFFVLPVLRITPPSVTALICFLTLSLYLLYIAKMAGIISWYYSYAVPICLIICAMTAVTCVLVSRGIAHGVHIPALISLETAIFLICIEIICDHNMFGRVDLKWSLITMCVFVSITVLCEAVAYVVRLNGKK